MTRQLRNICMLVIRTGSAFPEVAPQPRSLMLGVLSQPAGILLGEK